VEVVSLLDDCVEVAFLDFLSLDFKFKRKVWLLEVLRVRVAALFHGDFLDIRERDVHAVIRNQRSAKRDLDCAYKRDNEDERDHPAALN